MKKLKPVKFPVTPNASVRSGKDALAMAEQRRKEGYSKIFVIQMDNTGSLNFEAAGINDMERIAMLEMAKVLTIRDRFA